MEGWETTNGGLDGKVTEVNESVKDPTSLSYLQEWNEAKGYANASEISLKNDEQSLLPLCSFKKYQSCSLFNLPSSIQSLQDLDTATLEQMAAAHEQLTIASFDKIIKDDKLTPHSALSGGRTYKFTRSFSLYTTTASERTKRKDLLRNLMETKQEHFVFQAAGKQHDGINIATCCRDTD